MLTLPILITIRISDAQTDIQIVPVDSDSLIRNLLYMPTVGGALVL